MRRLSHDGLRILKFNTMWNIRVNWFCVLLCFVIVACEKTPNGEDGPPVTVDSPKIVKVDSYLDRITIQWEEVSNTQKYEVRYAETSDMKDAITTEETVLSKTVTDLGKGKDFYWQIRALVGNSWTDWSVTERFSTASYEVSIATYNILGVEYDPDIEPEYAWNLRKDALRDIVLQPNNNPDIIGLQECRLQTDDVVERLEGLYDSHVSDRQISARAIFWKSDKFELVSYDDNIDIFGSQVSGYHNQRYISQVRLKEKETGKDLFVYNIHLPAGNSGTLQSVRGVGAKAVAEHGKRLADEYGIPVIVLGDFNNYNEPYIDNFPPAPTVFKENGLVDAYDIALNKVNNNYSSLVNRSNSTATIDNTRRRHLDYVLGYPYNLMSTIEHAVIINFLNGSVTQLQKPVPSDHHPVRTVWNISY